MTVSPDDERPHQPGAETTWVETTWLELYDAASELAGVIRLDVRPNQGRSDVSFMFFLLDDGLVAAPRTSPQVPDASRVTEIADARFETIEPLRRWSVTYDGSSHTLASAADFGDLEARQKSRCERLIVELDVTATQDAVPGNSSFAQPVRAGGEVWVSGDRYVVAACGLRGKSWGGGRMARRASYVALSFDDDRVVFARVETPKGEGVADVVEGWTSIGGVVGSVHALRLEHVPGASGAAPSVKIVFRDDRGEHRIDAELLQVAPIPVGRRSLRLGVARARWDGHAGHGFVEELD